MFKNISNLLKKVSNNISLANMHFFFLKTFRFSPENNEINKVRDDITF